METKHYKVPLHNRILRSIFRPIFRGIFHIISNVQIDGRTNIPDHGAYVIAINHISLFEPPFMLAFWPYPPEAAGAVDLWSRPGISLLARLYGGIKVHREQYDRKLIDTLVNVLNSDYPLLLAPEGGRSHKPGMIKAHPGVAYLIDITKAPVVPVGITGSTEDFFSLGVRGKRPTIAMNIGEPFHLPPIEGHGPARRISRQRNADMIMRKIADLLPTEYQGYYRLESNHNDS